MVPPEPVVESLHIRGTPRGAATVDRRLEAEIARQLRTRLILVDGCLLLATTVYHIAAMAGLLADTGIDWSEWLFFLLALAALLLLLTYPESSLRTLRFLEAAVFAVTALSFSVWQWRTYRSSLYPDTVDVSLLELVGDSLCLPWFTLITFYGACIPNSGRRCAGVVGALTLIGLGTIAVVCLDDPNVGPQWIRTAFTKAAIWLVAGSIIAVYGSNRLQVLRREALLARELGQYTLKQKLGAGGMGEVFLAEHRLLRRPCALKLIRPERAGDALTLERFQREVKAMASLTHPCTVQVFDYGLTDDGVFYYVMEHLRGMNLQELVERHGPLPPARAVYLIRQACGALSEAHARGLLHRDIKPSNLFVGECGLMFDAVKLLDFGLVQQVGAPGQKSISASAEGPGLLTQAGSLPGTPLYLSPEQATGSVLDARSDIFSLGLVAYFLLSTQTPFRRETLEKTVAARLTDVVPPLLDVCPSADVDLNTVVMRCLERDPAARFPTVDQLAAALISCACAPRWTATSAASWWRLNAPGNTSGGRIEL